MLVVPLESSGQDKVRYKVCVTVASWKEGVVELMVGYGTNDTWNLDETGVFWQALPEKGFGQRTKQRIWGKNLSND
uniref:Uncharacterized protein n=1 Tax=Amphimedon queenslandica TaxID=400682 RepID=A0A1X7VAQ0_AMPQE